MKTSRFKAKVRPGARVYHYWKTTDTKGLYVSICNPGLTRCTSELHDIKQQDTMCKVCKIHI